MHDSARRSIATSLLGLAAMSTSGCKDGVLAPLGAVGAAERQLLFEAVGVMSIAAMPVIVLTLAFAWWLRASNKRATGLPTWEYSGKIEFTVWAIPILVVLFLAGMTYVGSHELEDAKVERAIGCAAADIRMRVTWPGECAGRPDSHRSDHRLPARAGTSGV